MDRETLLALAAVGRGEARRLSEQLGKPIDADMNALIMLARTAARQYRRAAAGTTGGVLKPVDLP